MKKILSLLSLTFIGSYTVPPDCSKLRAFWLKAWSYSPGDLERFVRSHDYCGAKVALEARVDSNQEIIDRSKGKPENHNLITLLGLGVTMPTESGVGAATTEDMKALLIRHKAKEKFECSGVGCTFSHVWRSIVKNHKLTCAASVEAEK